MSHSEVKVSVSKIRVDLESLPQLFNRQVVLSRATESISTDRIDDERKGVELLSALDLGQSFLVSAQFRQYFGIPLMGGCIAWVQLDGTPELPLGTWPVP